MSSGSIENKKLELNFSKESYETAEKCLALLLLRSLYEKGQINNEAMKMIERMFQKSGGKC